MKTNGNRIEQQIEESVEVMDAIESSDLGLPVVEAKPRPGVTITNSGQPWEFYQRIAKELPQWWDEFNSELNKDGRLKYRTVLDLARAKTKLKKEQEWIYEMIGPYQVIAKKITLRVPYLCDWKLRRQQGYTVPQMPSQIKALARSLKDKLVNIEAVRSIAPYIVQKQMQLERMDQQIDEVFGGQPFDLNLPPTHWKNKERWNVYFEMKTAVLTLNQKLWRDWEIVNGMHPDHPESVVQVNQLVSMGTNPGGLLDQGTQKEQEVIRLAQHLKTHADMFNMPLPKRLEGEVLPPEHQKEKHKGNGKSVQ